jgi:hypothetical protein
MKKKVLALMLMGVMLLTTAAPAFALGGSGGGDQGSGGPGGRGDEGPPTLGHDYRAS